MTETIRIIDDADLKLLSETANSRKLPIEGVINLAVRDKLKSSENVDQIQFQAVNEQYMAYIDSIENVPPATAAGFDEILERLRYFGQFVTTEEMHVTETD